MMNTYSQVLLDPKHQMTFDVEHLETGMNLTIKGCPQAQINSNTEHTEASETTSLLSNGATISKGSIDRKKKKVAEASLFLVLARTFGPDLLKAWFCKLMYDLLQFVSPQLLRSASLLYCTVACREFSPSVTFFTLLEHNN